MSSENVWFCVVWCGSVRFGVRGWVVLPSASVCVVGGVHLCVWGGGSFSLSPPPSCGAAFPSLLSAVVPSPPPPTCRRNYHLELDVPELFPCACHVHTTDTTHRCTSWPHWEMIRNRHHQSQRRHAMCSSPWLLNFNCFGLHTCTRTQRQILLNTYFSTCCSRGTHARCDHISKLTLR